MVTTPDVGASVNEWVNVVRRGRLGPTVKLVALTIATYANSDGTKIFPGIARLAVQCEVDYRTARRALAALRSMGLIELVKRGARKLGKSDEYRLILSASLLEHCEIPTPDAES
jgi:DNA-binding transcriptional ArsR family regulator